MAENASDSAISLQPTGPAGSLSMRGTCTSRNHEKIIRLVRYAASNLVPGTTRPIAPAASATAAK